MKSYLFLTILISVVSCTSKSDRGTGVAKEKKLPGSTMNEQQLFAEVMKVHDEMMPQMEIMMQLKGQLVKKTDSLIAIGADKVAELASVRVLQLEKADDAMMDWMRQFDIKMEGMNHDDKLVYLHDQKMKMDSVKKMIMKAMEEARTTLNE